MGLYFHCGAFCPGMDGVGPLYSYYLRVLGYYIFVNVVILVVYLMIVLGAVALVVVMISVICFFVSLWSTIVDTYRCPWSGLSEEHLIGSGW